MFYFILYVHLDRILDLFIEELPDDCVWLTVIFIELFASLDIVRDLYLTDHVHTDLIGIRFVGICL